MLRMILETFGADDRVVVEACRLDAVDPSPDQLHPDERPAIRQAVAKRRREFIAGRLLARRAAGRWGRPALVLPMAADRAPRWPDSLRGSITHCGQWCAAALCRATDGIAIGIDLEDHPRIDDSLVPMFMTARERHRLEDHPQGERALLTTLVFSAKEAAFKAQYAVTRAPMDFQDLETAVDLAAGCFRTTVRSGSHGHPMDGSVLPGRFFRTDGLVGTCVLIDDPVVDRCRTATG
ncbi:4'-phosphopantetheinyl transferase superfamily protein [Azospirillum sp. RWY-5-1]|uniref:Enterobactin synthase component D n=2 Tax=Azospirillum oleiclasticum TaxID=2735135 RepID=A0ABX2T9A9_9PROT|nr:4'-phosphopantetheinyl transferase superfamily protein [Azospirillum oleiclasticum]NYZ20912.1 4'-phosphopantetheinyl transferase superfamily protein [Azospirillum oleiclasticum]